MFTALKSKMKKSLKFIFPKVSILIERVINEHCIGDIIIRLKSFVGAGQA